MSGEIYSNNEPFNAQHTGCRVVIDIDINNNNNNDNNNDKRSYSQAVFNINNYW